MPPRKCLEILIANGAFWINLSHPLRAEISQIFSNIFHSSPATYFILVGSYWKKGGSAPKKKGGGVRAPWTPPWIRPCRHTSEKLANCKTEKLANCSLGCWYWKVFYCLDFLGVVFHSICRDRVTKERDTSLDVVWGQTVANGGIQLLNEL